jgi:hypothetical protein
MREPGFYWIRLKDSNNDWTVAEYCGNNQWIFNGTLITNVLHWEIDERRIVRDEEDDRIEPGPQMREIMLSIMLPKKDESGNYTIEWRT